MRNLWSGAVVGAAFMAVWIAISVSGQDLLPPAEVPPSEESVSMEVKASAYNSTKRQTVGDPNEGAWGDRIEPGMKVIAVSPDLLEAGLVRGTQVEIEGVDGTWTVMDRTASRHRNRIDIYMGVDVEAAREWGIRDVTINVLEVD